jgi:NADPH:quinone reductase-like Zn-dependent oxidoreductase
MKKIVIHSAGGHDKLKIEEHQDLKARPEHIVVSVKASGVNYADVCVRWGIYESAKQYVGWPITPGFEYAGIVKEVGDGVTDFNVGDEVFGVTFFDGYSSEVCVPKYQLYHKPSTMSFEQAACFPAVHMTAYHALFQLFILRPENRVLVHSAAGGVGSALCQLLLWFGCDVVGIVGSSHKVDYLRDLGVKKVIDKSKDDLWAKAQELSPAGYDVILDANGVKTLGDSYKHLAPTGKLIVYGFHTMLPKASDKLNFISLVVNYFKTPRFNAINLTSDNKSVLGFNLSFLFDKKELLNEAMTKLIDLYEQEKIMSPKVTSFTYQEVASAHGLIESGKSTGKIAITWD